MLRNAIVLGALLAALTGCNGTFDNLFSPAPADQADPATTTPAPAPPASAAVEAVSEEPPPPAPLPKPKPPLRHDEVIELQSALLQFGYDPGPVDGLVGPRTSGAVRAYQQATGLPVDGQVSFALLLRLRGEVKSAAATVERDAQAAKRLEPAAGGPRQQGIFSRIFKPLFGE